MDCAEASPYWASSFTQSAGAMVKIRLTAQSALLSGGIQIVRLATFVA
jgi:hypothetical protein